NWYVTAPASETRRLTTSGWMMPCVRTLSASSASASAGISMRGCRGFGTIRSISTSSKPAVCGKREPKPRPRRRESNVQGPRSKVQSEGPAFDPSKSTVATNLGPDPDLGLWTLDVGLQADVRFLRDHFLGQRTVGAGAARGGVVVEDGAAVAGSLAQAD